MSGVNPARDTGAALSAVAHALYELENGPDLVFVRSQAEAGGAAAVAIVDELAGLWEQYPVAAAAVEQLDEAAARKDEAGVASLLAPDGLLLPDGRSTGLAGFVAALRRRAEEVTADAARLAGTARQAVSQVDAAVVELAGLETRAAAAGAAADPELVAARSAVDAALAAVAADPAGAAPFVDVDRALDVARRRVELVESLRRDLPGDLAAAEAQLDEIRRLVREGTEGLAKARSRIAGAEGLLEPLDPSGLDGDERALGPWLDRITRQAAAGGWRAAAEGLERWRKVADGWLANAERVASANTAGVRRRNELRGLLTAYRAKAVARGGAEDEVLAQLHRAASDALHVAPCDLHVAEAAVRRFVDAVNQTSRSAT